MKKYDRQTIHEVLSSSYWVSYAILLDEDGRLSVHLLHWFGFVCSGT